MKIVKIVAAVGVLCLPVAAVSTPVMAASAHNSQLGGMGNTSNNAGASGMHKRMTQMKRHTKRM